MKKYQTATLDNGLRIIHMAHESDVVYCGYQIAAGTRNERTEEEGLAHFCEHMTFKGTTRFNALQVANRLEQVGGDINAFTTKESTVYHCAVLNQHMDRAIDLLTDIVFRSTFPADAIEKEKEVICDEIESYNDSPAELIFDQFENLLFKNHPLGHNILGTTQQVQQLTQTDAQQFTQRFYTTRNSIFFCYGNVDFEWLLRRLKRYTADCRSHAVELTAAPTLPTLKAQTSPTILSMGTHQTHVMIGTQAYSVHDSRRMPLYLLNNLLGGPAMSAMLNQTLRERHGLVYTVESIMVPYAETGLWAIYFGSDPKDTSKCLQLIRRTLNNLMRKPLSPAAMAKAKQQLKGQISIACDNREQFALDFGKSFLHYGWEKDISTLFENIDQITAGQLQEVAQELFEPNRLQTLILN